ncbi:RNA polymerase I enhancer binding protein [Linnemannia zychae]|nr:RNA polymerase I enhancer binding protein [Linnemannia zychae]
MDNQSEVNRKRKNTEEESTAGFKKALVSATTTFDHGLNEFGAQELPAGDAPQADTRPHANATRLLPADARRDQPSRTPTTSEVQAADAVLSTMVGILAGTGDGRHEPIQAQQPEHRPTQHNRLNQHHHSTSHHSAAGAVSDDVLHMQQQLQQQIPLDSSAQSRLTHHQLMDSMSSIPNMQLLLEESLKRDMLQKREGSDGQRRREDTVGSAQSSAVEDARTVLMKLNDPSILVTLEPHTVRTPQSSHPSSPLSNTSPADLPPVADRGKGKKKTTKASRAISGAVTGDNKDDADTSAFDFQERLRSDTAAVTSDNPLHTKWLMATALKDKGISYKTGTFSSHEDELIRETIKGYVARNNMPEDAIQRWFENGNGRGRFEKNDLKALWVEIAVRLQNRPLLNIYLHVRRMFHPQNNIGTWSKEDDQKLIMLHALHKGQWTTIGTELGRMADSCRDRYRNHLKDQSTMLTGPWQPHEDEQLLTIMQDLALQQGKINILDSSPMWTLISERMRGTRTRHQCRHRYSQTLQPRLERGEWTAPSSAAAAAAAAVAANAAVAASASSSSSSKQASQQQHLQAHTGQLGLGLSPNPGLSPNHGVSPGHEQGKTTAEQDVLMIAAALQGVLPSHDNGHMLWSQAVSNDMQDTHHSLSPGSHDPFTAAAIAAAASLPLPTIVPKAPKGPIRRRSGLQQQLDTLRIIQEDGYTDHTDIDWSNIAQRLRDRVEEANAIQLAKIIQTHDQLDSKKQRHLQDGDSAAAASAAASAAMAAAVSAAQAEAVASLQRVPAANQCARTFMSSRCKIEGYRDMTLQQVIVFMMKDVERRIMHRRGGPGSSSKRNDSSGGGADGAEGPSSKSSPSGALSKEASKEAVIQQQEIIINNAAQQAAIAALSAQFPFLQQHHQHQHGQSALAHALSDPSEPHFSAHSSSSASAIPQTSSTPPSSSSYAAYSEESLSAEQIAQRQQELEQQQHNHDLAEQMLNFAFSVTDMSHNPFHQHPHVNHHNHQQAPHQHQQQHQQGSMMISPSMSSTSSMSSVSSSSWPVDEASSSVTTSQREKQATRRVLHALKSSDFATDTSEDDDEAEDGSEGNPQG